MTRKSLILLLIITAGCSTTKQPTPQLKNEAIIEVEHDYQEIKDYQITWEAMFDVSSTSYYVYLYSLTCNHCEELKNFVIEKALDKKNIYFSKASQKDQIGNTIKSSIGAENPGDIWILGYPSLLKIMNGKCTKNLAGVSQIKDELK